ncbi:MAG: phenylalanine--tRNA ligase subunit beta [Zoogloeaceae bacterium]|jgi:phenylalanyl-tRNA synthetase beta chain|nr:phenylalanine--tRNA ligase subunit beta [Zoogloeaceae bacterium]
MKFSDSWLRTLVDHTLSNEEVARLLTMSGLEVEETEPVAPPFSQVVVAKVVRASRHPDAHRLHVCEVETGESILRKIVCGAPNVAPGLKVPCALPGATLPGGARIQKTKVRGVESEGMLCSAKELGISEDASGLMILPEDAPTGADIRAYLDLDDTVYTLKLTPNRADCLSLFGVAREVAALTGISARFPDIPVVPTTCDMRQTVRLAAPAACPRYCGRVLRGVNARSATPEWMRRRLERCGLRSVSALVDVTNYVMLEMGQPLHAFDHARLSGGIEVRMAKEGEALTLINGQEAALSSDVLVIADEARALAMAGVMGGAESAITLETRDVFLESAFFAPEIIAGRARRYNFASDASHRFERGVDWNQCLSALERASSLILEICGGVAGPVTTAEETTALPKRPPARLRLSRLAQVLGIPFSRDVVAEYLSRLSLAFVCEGEEFMVTPPSYRFDLALEVDLIEEVARLHGYDRIPYAAPTARLAMREEAETCLALPFLRQRLVDRGFQELIQYVFVPEEWERDFAANERPVRLANPIDSARPVLRSTLFGSLIEALAVNLRRKEARVRVFEIGRCFSQTEGAYAQPWRLAALAYGAANPEGWGTEGRRADFFDLKGDLAAMLLPKAAVFIAAPHPALHPGRSAKVMLGEREIGWLGELHPQWVQRYELPAAPVLFEIDLEAARMTPTPRSGEISRFQPVTRDLAIVVDQKLSWQTILDGLERQAPKEVTGIFLFDLYQGKGIPDGRKSLAFRIVMQDTQRTLSETDIDGVVTKIMAWLEQNCGARLRA